MRHLFIGIFLFSWSWALSQSINTEFGKNRVQFHDDFDAWNRYETENFITYWYGKGRQIAQAVIQTSELDHDEIQKILEHRIRDKIQVIVYTDLSDMKQSNIGTEETFINEAGKTKIEGNKMFVYFNGDHQHLRQQIRQGITSVYLNSILFGSNLQEIVQNAVLLNLPDWFKEGIIAYGASNWDHEIDDELRDLLDTDDKYENFEDLALDHPRVAGHSLWFYIDQTYGKSTIANIIYLTRINRKLENAFIFILGDNFEYITQEWSRFFKEHYSIERKKFDRPSKRAQLKLKNKQGVPISHLRISPNSKKIAYTYNDKGKYKVSIKDIKSDAETIVFKYGKKNIFQETDFNYPLIAWHPDRPEITIVYEHRDIVKMRKINITDKTWVEQDLTGDYQRVYSIDYINDLDYLFSASTDGYSDLYIYQSNFRSSQRLTEDFYDDLEAQVIDFNGKKAVLFASNRKSTYLTIEKLDTILPIDNFDIFLMTGIDDDRSLIRLTETPDFSERQPFLIDKDKYVYLSEKSGIINTYMGLLTGSPLVTPLSNHSRNVIIHHAVPGFQAYSFYDLGRYNAYFDDLELEPRAPFVTRLFRSRQGYDDNIVIPLLPEEDDTRPSFTEGMKFQSRFGDPKNLEPLTTEEISRESDEVFEKYFTDYYSDNVQDGRRVIKYNPMRASAARLKFRVEDFTTSLDNEVLFEGLESYTGNDRELTYQPVGILFKATLKDLFEDYEVEAGIRIPTTFNGSEYFITLDNNKYLLDHRFAIYRRVTSQNLVENAFPAQKEKRHIILGMYRVKYPFDIYTSLRLTSSLRFDKYFRLSTEANSFNQPFINEKRLSLKAEYVYDNSFDVNVNIKNGTRYKFYVEALNEFNFELANETNIDLSTGFTTIIGFDARHYIPILKQAVFAVRGAGATSFGSKKMIYYIGGVQNWIGAQFNQDIPLPEGNDFAFKALAPNLRGFKHNIRNGSTFVLGNAELRVPVFQMLRKSKSRFGLFRNLQFTGFFDAGLAWHGLSPYGEDNPLNSIFIANPPDNPVITIEAESFRDPLVMGYGFGVRTTLLGYFLKFDYAWGIETRQVQDPRWYISLGTDF